MSYAVEVHFDAAAEARLRGIWKTICDAGIVCAPLQAGYTPHISLMLLDTLDTDCAKPLLEDLCKNMQQFPLTFSGFGGFVSETSAAFLLPVASHELLDLHSEVQQVLDNLHGKQVERYREGSWLPHCSLNHGMHKSEWRKLGPILSSLELPFSAMVECLVLTELTPASYQIHLRVGFQQPESDFHSAARLPVTDNLLQDV